MAVSNLHVLYLFKGPSHKYVKRDNSYLGLGPTRPE